MRQVTSLPSLCPSSFLIPFEEIHVGFVSVAVAWPPAHGSEGALPEKSLATPKSAWCSWVKGRSSWHRGDYNGWADFYLLLVCQSNHAMAEDISSTSLHLGTVLLWDFICCCPLFCLPVPWWVRASPHFSLKWKTCKDILKFSEVITVWI